MLKKSASCVPCLRRSEAPASRRQVAPLSYSRTAVYAPCAKRPAALPEEGRVSARRGWEGEKAAFLNILIGFGC